MTLEELQSQADKDLVIDDTELDTESLRTPILHNKYLQYYNKFNLLLKKSQCDVHIYINADEDIQKVQAKIVYQEAIVNYLEQILRMINNRSFTIKNAIEWRRFTSGAV